MTKQRQNLLQQTFKFSAIKLHNSTGIEFRECIKHMAGSDIQEASEMSFDSVYAELEKVINETCNKLNLKHGNPYK